MKKNHLGSLACIVCYLFFDADMKAHRELTTASPVYTKIENAEERISAGEPLSPLRAPLEFISPSIRAFEPANFSVPGATPEPQFQAIKQQPTFVEPQRAINQESKISKEREYQWMEAPLGFISPSIRSFSVSTSLSEQQGLTPFSYGLSGYIKNEAFFDSCQVIGDRQDEYLLFPSRPLFDCANRNVNRKGSFNMLDIESRVRGEISGPYVFGARSWAIMEIDAWAAALLDIGLIRIRHAFIYFEWENKSLILGQYWHPLLLPECYADTISFNGGTPFDPFAREPQMRLTKQFGSMTFIVSAGAHANSPYDGPIGLNTIYARHGVLPNIDIQLFSSIYTHLWGVGVDITRLVPRLITNKNFKVNESLVSFVVMAFAAFNWENLILRLKAIYAQNGFAYSMISGYAVHSIDPYTDQRQYTNTQCVTAWLDAAYRGEVEPGIFIGIGKNLGANKTILTCTEDPETHTTERLIYAAGFENIDVLLRVQPRVRWFLKPFIFAAELELTGASWGKVTETGRVINAELVNNVRCLLAAFYVF